MSNFVNNVVENAAGFMRPVLILVCGMLLFNLPTLIYKVRMFLRGILYLLFCNDKSWKKTPDPEHVFKPILASDDADEKIERKTIYFVRHGESTWNDTFNKGAHRSAIVFVLGFFPGLVKALLYELYLVLSGKLDSWFYDSPISGLGLGQVQQLSKFLRSRPTGEKEAQHLAVLRADPGAPSSKIISSSLRRAVSTVVGGFRDRLRRRREEKVLIVPALQEISRNPDTLSITPAFTPIQAAFTEKGSKICNFQEVYDNQVDMSLHYGNKPLKTNGLRRMIEFCDFCFSGSVKEERIIVGGHSIWFRSYFRTFLPFGVDHPSKKKKIVNGGIVVFDLLKTQVSGATHYMVDPKSVKVVYGGYA